MSSTATVTDLCTQLRLLLESSPDALTLKELLARVEAFVEACSGSPDSGTLRRELEDELQVIYDEVLGHAFFPQAEVFLAVLYHLRPVLPSHSIISTWFDLVLRPTLREPKLPLTVVNHAKELILYALDPGNNFSDSEEGSTDAEKQKERVGDFRRRLMDLYLLDAFNESSGEDVLEWAELSEEERERKACWKANLEDVLVRVGLQRPQDFLTELYRCFDSPVSRLQLLILLSVYTSEVDFPDHAEVLASHPLMTSLLHCLVFDTSSTACTVALTTLIKLLPIFAVKACEQLKRLLPLLLVVLARIICWKERPSPETAIDSDTEDDAVAGTTQNLPIREDIGWNPLELTFDGPQSKAPSAHRYFTFLYYLFPCNTIRFLRYPVKYLDDNGLESLYAVDWERALDEDKIRSKSERLLRSHILHPLLIWREATEELEQPDFWTKYDVPQIVSRATMLDVRSAVLGIQQQEDPGSGTQRLPTPSVERGRALRPPSIRDIAPPEAENAETVPLSSSLDTVYSAALMPEPPGPTRLKVSLSGMVATSVALKSGLDIEVVDASPSWASTLFPLQPGTRSPSRADRELPQSLEEAGDAPSTPAQPEHEPSGDGAIPRHVAQAISALQREVLLLKNDLNLELWTARENVKHIGRLYKERVLSRNEEVERQGLHNRLKEYKHREARLRQELKEEKDQAAAQRVRYTDWNKELQDRIAALRAEKKTWTTEAAAMRAAEKEAKDTFEAQRKLLAEANHTVFRLQTQIKEHAHKVDRLYDYETQIDQLMRLQRLWESDVHKLNDSKEYLAAFASKYKKMELRVDAYERTQMEMEENTAAQRQQILLLESKLDQCKKQLEQARRTSIISRQSELPAEWRRTQEANEKLRNENEELRDEIEEVKAMVEVLKAQRAGRTGLVHSPRSSPPI
ncbi:Hamartin protein-domain-containing protein [Cerioporus squamosus]|nr:Hamartin protein-domain-containing protein [Cerioporus squamosus]